MSSKTKIRSRLLEHEQKLAYKLLLPTFIILALIAFYPLASVFYTSFTNQKFGSSQKAEFVGLQNYKELLSLKFMKVEEGNEESIRMALNKDKVKGGASYKELARVGNTVIGATDPKFLNSVKDTILFSVMSVIIELILGMGIALVMNAKFKGQGAMRTAMLVPWAIITVVSAKIWQMILFGDGSGMFNSLFSKIGLTSGNVTYMTDHSLASMVAIDVWKTTPFMALLILAGLQLIPASLYEAADVDGANKIRQFFTITLPLVKPSIAVALVFRMLDALRVFDLFQVLLGQSKFSMASYNYSLLIDSQRGGYSSAVGVLIFLIIFGFAILFIKSMGVDSDD